MVYRDRRNPAAYRQDLAAPLPVRRPCRSGALPVRPSQSGAVPSKLAK
jgi:hypothetical protein